MGLEFKTILDNILKLGETVLPFLQGTPAGPIIAIGKEVLSLIDKAQEVLDEDDASRLQTLRDELEPLVMAHADATADKLRGDDAPESG